MGLRVIGAGLGRTGTASMKVALELLGAGRCYHMAEVVARPAAIPLWVRAARGHADWDEIFSGYGATVDYPACTFWRQLADYYPAAKVLLTVRDAEEWFESTHQTVMSPVFVEYLSSTPFNAISQCIWSTMDGRMHDREFMLEHFRRHVEDVKRTIPEGRLLVFDVKEGWEPLCAFLDLPVPNVPFPRINSREETIRLVDAAMSGAPDGSFVDRLAEATEELFRERAQHTAAGTS